MESLKTTKGISLGLDVMNALCSTLNNPQDTFKSIHIAGTNGKGSVGAYIESILIQAGYTVGRYVSPAIEDTLETITINRKRITSSEYKHHLDRVNIATKNIVSNGFRLPTQFELDTAIAFDYLSNKCDIAIIEVGMGGRLDATNVLHNKILSVITSISIDHTKFLGNTLSQIAFEKCGIIQQNVPTVTISQCDDVLNTIKCISNDKNSHLTIANAKDIHNVQISKDYILNFDYLNYTDLKSKLIGDFQTDNAILSIKACEVLKISKQYIIKGIYNATWKYRFDIISREPLFILDGCHNADASIRLRKSIDTYFKGKSICYIMGIFKDKDYKSIVKNLCSRADIIYTIATVGDRSFSAEALADVIKEYNTNVIACNTIPQAISLSKASNKDVTIAFGSLSTLSKFKV